jgi:hypothetical protein
LWNAIAIRSIKLLNKADDFAGLRSGLGKLFARLLFPGQIVNFVFAKTALGENVPAD